MSMDMSRTAAVLLAAGRGTRMRSTLPKPLVPLAGRGLTLRLLDAVQEAGIGHPVVVVGPLGPSSAPSDLFSSF